MNKLISRVQAQGSDAGKGTIGLIIGVVCAALALLIAGDAFGWWNFGN